MSLFCTSNGTLISFAGGIYGGRYIASKDYGSTWYYVGDDFGAGKLEAGFWESDSGYIYSILRQNNSDPALIRINREVTEYTIIYTFGQFNFRAYYNPTKIIKLPDGKLLLFGGSRRKDENDKMQLIEAIETEENILNNIINNHVILKQPVISYMTIFPSVSGP